MRVERLGASPIITPESDPSIGANINGPSLIRVPEWVARPLGRYYLYFAAHRGAFIRLAHSNTIDGSWQVYRPGALHLADSHFIDHIASPDVHVDHAARDIVMYYHGVCEDGTQATRLAVSSDGLRFRAAPEILGPWYLRAFEWRGWWYALAMPGVLYRSRTGRTPFERGPALLSSDTRHTAVWVEDGTLFVVFSRVGDYPERLLVTRVILEPDWSTWRAEEPYVLLEPDADYEGANLPLTPSARGEVTGPCRQLRDPAIFEEGTRRYLLYAVAGESGIAVARIVT